MESVYLYNLEVTPTSKIVDFSFVEYLEDISRLNISKEFMEAGSRYLNSNELCDGLDIGRPGWIHYVHLAGFRWTVMSLAFMQRTIPWLEKIMIAVSFPIFRDFCLRK